MRVSALAVIFFLLTTGSVASQTPPVRDAQAMALLGGLRSALGGGALVSVKDTVAVADVMAIRDGAASVSKVTIMTLGRDGVRVEGDTAQGQVVFVMDGRRAISVDASGNRTTFSRKAFGEIGVPHLPLLSVLGDLNDVNCKVEYVGLETSAKGTVHHIRLQKSLDPALGLGDFDAPIEVYVDTQSFLPTRIAYALRPPENFRSRVPIELNITEYRPISGLVVPIKFSYSIRGSIISQYTLLSFAVNQGVNAADFEVKP